MPFRNYSLTKNGQLTIGQILSPNYVAGVSGWEIRKDGSAEFNSLTIRGTFDGTDYVINSGGAFFYNGTPAAGNLITSIAAMAGTDAFGNAYPQGLKVYGTGGSAAAYVLLDPVLGRIVIQNELTGFQAVCDGGSLTMSTPSSAANPATYAVQDSPLASIIESPGDGTHATYETKLYAATGSTPAYAQVPLQVALDPSSGSAETWHNITADSGWTGVVTPQYRLLPDGNVQLRGQLTHTGTAVAIFFNNGHPLPAAYQPSATRVYRPPISADAAGTVSMGTNGVITMRASGFTATQIILDGIYSI
jgi:hypothetical protein